jgi:arsenate reductase
MEKVVMSKIKIYHNPRCSKSRQTRAILDDNGLDYDVIEYLEHPPTQQELKRVLKMLNKKPLEIIRTGEKLFKELGLNKKDDRTDAEWVKIMVDNPKLIERPIVINGDKAAMGRPPEDVLNIL